MYDNLAILALFAFLYSVVAGRLERTPFNGALLFIAFGLAFGPMGLGLLHLNIDTEGLRLLAELTLALILFTDASNANLRVLRHGIRNPQRLLLIGLPLTIMLGFGAAEKLFMGWFGPRGLASIVFLVIVLDENLPGSRIIASTVVCTIVLSVSVHGISANPLVAALAAKLERRPSEA